MSDRKNRLARVEYRAEGARWTLVFSRDLGHPPERVWAALTEAEQLGRWAPFLADRDLDRCGEATLTMVDGENREDLPASISRAESPWLLEYTWGEDLLRWGLEAIEGGTRLTLSHTLEDRDWIDKTAAGWHLCLEVALAQLGGEAVDPIRGEEAMDHGWEELRARYARELNL